MARRLKSFATLALVVSVRAHGITPNPEEIEMAGRIANHEEQRRSAMVYHPTLNVVARARALDLGRRNYFSHIDPDGYGPNYAVRLADYRLPESWSPDKENNCIESIVAGYATVAEAFEALLESRAHRRHILGKTDFFREQTYYGVGYVSVPGTASQYYYVFISAPPDETARLKQFTEWKFERMTSLQMDHPEHDHDQDGFDDLVEYAFNMNPTVASPEGLPVVSEEDGERVLRYQKDTSKTDITYVAQKATEFEGWTPTCDVVKETKGPIETRTAAIPEGAIARVKIQLTPLELTKK
jgi:hypothetical protein